MKEQKGGGGIERDRETERQTDRQTDRHRQTDRQTQTKTEGERRRERERDGERSFVNCQRPAKRGDHSKRSEAYIKSLYSVLLLNFCAIYCSLLTRKTLRHFNKLFNLYIQLTTALTENFRMAKLAGSSSSIPSYKIIVTYSGLKKTTTTHTHTHIHARTHTRTHTHTQSQQSAPKDARVQAGSCVSGPISNVYKLLENCHDNGSVQYGFVSLQCHLMCDQPIRYLRTDVCKMYKVGNVSPSSFFGFCISDLSRSRAKEK